MPEFQPGITPENQYQTDNKISGKTIPDSVWGPQKIRDAIVAMALHHCDTEEYELLGIGIAALGHRLQRMLEESKNF